MSAGRVRITVTFTAPIEEFEHYEATSLEQAASNWAVWMKEDPQQLSEAMEYADDRVFTVEPLK